MSFAGKTALVTGGATGLGRAYALLLAKQGANVAIAGIDLPQAQRVVADIQAAGGKAAAYHCDVAAQDQVTAVFAKAFADFKAFDFAFINAGVVQLGKLMDVSLTDVEWMFKVNVFGALHCTRCFVQGVQESGASTAHITFTGSENSLSLPSSGRYNGVGGYNMTKHAMLAMADTLRFELAKDHISISLAVPGGVQTQIMSSVAKRQPEFGGPGSLAMPDLGAVPDDVFVPPVITPDQAAAIILQGVANKQFYIPTHSHILEDFSSRSKEIETAFAKGAELF